MERDLIAIASRRSNLVATTATQGIEEAQYAVDDGFVQLYGMSGQSMGPDYRRKLPPNLTANEWAAKMLRETVWKRRSNFNRPLRYAPLKY
jgi:hypothetical protein